MVGGGECMTEQPYLPDQAAGFYYGQTRSHSSEIAGLAVGVGVKLNNIGKLSPIK